MNQRVLSLSLVALALIAGAGGLLRALRERQHQGLPGVRVVGTPSLGERGPLMRSNSVFLPTHLPGYSFEPLPITDLEVSYLPADTTFGRGRYFSLETKREAQASVVLMGIDRTSIHRPEYCLTSQGWTITRQQQATILAPGLVPMELQVQRFDTSITRQLPEGKLQRSGVYVFWFVADGERTASHWNRQWRLIEKLVKANELQRWAYISFFTTCDPGDEEMAFKWLSRLVATCAPQIEKSQPNSMANAESTSQP